MSPRKKEGTQVQEPPLEETPRPEHRDFTLSTRVSKEVHDNFLAEAEQKKMTPSAVLRALASLFASGELRELKIDEIDGKRAKQRRQK